MKSSGALLRLLFSKILVLLFSALLLATNVHAACNGDLNVNGKVDIGDALFALKYVVNLIPHDAVNNANYLATADVFPLDANLKPKGDSKIDIADALTILKRVVNLLAWEVTPNTPQGNPVKIALDATGTVQTTITATSPGGAQLTLNSGTRIALITSEGDAQAPASLDNIYISLGDSTASLPSLPAGITPLALFRIVLNVDGSERSAWFRPASTDTAGLKLVVPVADQSVSKGTMGLLFYLSSGTAVKVGSSALTPVGGATPGTMALSRLTSLAPLADPSGSSQMEFNPGGTGDYATGGSPPGSGSAPQGAFWSEFTVPDPGPVDLGGGVVVDDPSVVDTVIIVEDSTREILGTCTFGASNTAATGPSGSDGGQFWCERNQDTVKISSMQANLPKIHATRVSSIRPNLVMWQITNIQAADGLHGPDGSVYSDPYTHKEFKFAGFKKLMLVSKNYTIAKKHAREPLEQAGYSDLQSQFISPATEIDVTSLDARQKMQDDVILKEHWKLVAGETRGNLGTYEWKDKYKGTAKATMTFPPPLSYKVWEINAAEVTFEIDPTYTTMASDTVVYRATGGTITQTQYTVPGNAGGCYGEPGSFTDTYDIYPGDGYLSIFPGTDTVQYNASASISYSTPVKDHPYKECCLYRVPLGQPLCEDKTLEIGAQQHEWLRTGGLNSKLSAQSDDTLQGSYVTPPYSTPSYEWNLAPVYDNQ